jgi:hypothetical protein
MSFRRSCMSSWLFQLINYYTGINVSPVNARYTVFALFKHYRATWAFSVRLAMYHVFGIPLASSASAALMLGLAKR